MYSTIAARASAHGSEIRREVLGGKHPDYATCLNNRANLNESQKEYARAEPF